MATSIVTFHYIQDRQLGPNGVLYSEVPLYLIHHCVPSNPHTMFIGLSHGLLFLGHRRVVRRSAGTGESGDHALCWHQRG